MKRPRHLAAHAALLPMAATVILAYLGTVAWSVRISFSSSRTLPLSDFVGLAQYERLFGTERWILSLQNMALFGVLFISACLVLGFLLAVFIDQQVKGEGLLRTVFLYPYAMSFVATGLVWQWMLNPELGLQSTVRGLGFESFTFDWIVQQDAVMYAVVLAAVWQASGLVMALLLAGLRGVDDSLWKAARIEGIPKWRFYLSVVLPMLGPSFATALVLLAVAVVKVFDVVVAMTHGRPRPRQRSAGQVHHRPPVRPRQHRARVGRLHRAAAHRARGGDAVVVCKAARGTRQSKMSER